MFVNTLNLQNKNTVFNKPRFISRRFRFSQREKNNFCDKLVSQECWTGQIMKTDSLAIIIIYAHSIEVKHAKMFWIFFQHNWVTFTGWTCVSDKFWRITRIGIFMSGEFFRVGNQHIFEVRYLLEFFRFEVLFQVTGIFLTLRIAYFYRPHNLQRKQ